MIEKNFWKKICNQNSILIYGAGMVGELVYSRLLAAGMEEKISGFVVTQCKQKSRMFCRKPVFEVEEVVSRNKEVLVVVATLKGLHKEIEATLLRFGFENIIKVSDSLYRNMSQNYIRDFKTKHEKFEEDIDVMFMASDNNSSSGAFLCMVDLNCELVKQGVRTFVVLPEYGTGEKLLKEKKIPYTYILSEDWIVDDKSAVNLRKRICLIRNRNAVRELCKIIRDYNVKVIHNNTTYTYVGAHAAKRENIALVWHIREYIRFQDKKFLNKKRSIKNINRADKVIFISEYVKKCMMELNVSNRIVVYDGLDTSAFLIPDKELFKGNKISITLVGALVAHKRQEELLQAVAVLKRKGCTDFIVHLVGSGKPEYEKYLHDLVKKLEITEYVEFCGRQDNMRLVYEQTDIAVVCSGIEGFGRVTVEGQLAGSLVIAADSGATVELIEDGVTGLLYRAGEPESLAERIMEAINHPDKAGEIAARGREHAYKNYSKEKNAAEIIKIYEKILKRKLI